ncbi:MAG: phosphoadenylyl-sulfate reductase [Saprospiraceae bacterium]|nr:phosphoadenylyl-sulfate reductase [Saprospiraceae bacterium]MCF8248977.1 phosphoadenylyl-sulfate reductase [Saprospiraceae bacterium]MCF8279188.1 phosphoadenylyl-sulfate reductase [Bacteroidales bacterium]MCF8310871.1 phosphoadenylyl-sulfate reductase [Saprospiraceae bacterium]MCF8439541.1 phosphoadenylyl-sulfate reductase [Saprospiraceae bacterium]
MTDAILRKKTPTTEQLNEHFQQLDVEGRFRLLYENFDTEEVLVTSSFGADSALLLHFISRVNPSQKVYFIDTGFHFPSTYIYKKRLAKILGLQVVDIGPSPDFYKMTEQMQLWKSHPDTCCFLNKVMALEALKSDHQVWVSGVMGHQTAHRSQLRFFATGNSNDSIIKCCPLLDMDAEKSRQYKLEHRLPPHPLEEMGYGSIGCQHCTVEGCGRSGRWAGHDKTECGLHLEDTIHN